MKLLNYLHKRGALSIRYGVTLSGQDSTQTPLVPKWISSSRTTTTHAKLQFSWMFLTGLTGLNGLLDSAAYIQRYLKGYIHHTHSPQELIF